MNVSGIGTSALEQAASPAAPVKPNQLGQEDFLKLMVTQFQNQDPFKPMENGEFLGQIAQFSTVSGIEQLNSAFSQVASSLQEDKTLQAASLVGRDLLVATDSANVTTPGDGLKGQIELAQSGRVNLEVYDEAGQLVRKIDLGEQLAGQFKFVWDGRGNDGRPAPAGRYRIAAEVNAGGVNQAAPIQLSSRVESVSVGGASRIALHLEGIGPVNLFDVRQFI